jgi:hypothetical protein
MQAEDLKELSQTKKRQPKVEFLIPACELLAEA